MSSGFVHWRARCPRIQCRPSKRIFFVLICIIVSVLCLNVEKHVENAIILSLVCYLIVVVFFKFINSEHFQLYFQRGKLGHVVFALISKFRCQAIHRFCVSLIGFGEECTVSSVR